ESAPATILQGKEVGAFKPPPPCTKGMARPFASTGVNSTFPEAIATPPAFKWLAEMGVNCAKPHLPARQNRARKKNQVLFMGEIPSVFLVLRLRLLCHDNVSALSVQR